MIEPAFIEQGFDERDDGALIMRRQIRRAPEPSQEPGRARGREIVADGRQPEHLVGGHAKRPGEVREHRPGRLGIIGLVVGDDALRHTHGVAHGLLRNATPFADLRETKAEAVTGLGFHRRSRAQGGCIVGRPPTRDYYSEFPLPGFAMTARETLKRHRADVLKLAAQYGATDIRVFGSVARGDANESSDIDLLVRMTPGRSVFDIGGLLMDLQDLLGRRVDVVTERGLRPRVREQVLREAVPI